MTSVAAQFSLAAGAASVQTMFDSVNIEYHVINETETGTKRHKD